MRDAAAGAPTGSEQTAARAREAGPGSDRSYGVAMTSVLLGESQGLPHGLLRRIRPVSETALLRPGGVKCLQLAVAVVEDHVWNAHEQAQDEAMEAVCNDNAAAGKQH